MYLCICLIISFQAKSQANALIKNISFWEDKQCNASFEQVLKQNFTNSPSHTLNFSFTPSAYWVKVEIEHHLPNKQDYFIEIAYALLDKVEFYAQDSSGQWKKQLFGDHLVFQKRPINSKYFIFPITLQATPKKYTYYFYIHTSSAMLLPFTLYTPQQFYEKELHEEVGFGIFYGCMLAVALYYIFIYFIIKNPSYWVYVGYILSTLFQQAALYGHNFKYLYPESIYLQGFSVMLAGAGLVIFMTWFAMLFLGTKIYLPLLHRLFQLYIGIYLFMLPISAFQAISDLQIFYRLNTWLISIVIASILAAAVWRVVQGSKSSRIFLGAFAPLIFSFFTYIFLLLNLLPRNFYTNQAPKIGLVLQILIFSMALAYRYRRIKKQMEQVQTEANRTLEQKIKERTEELEKSRTEVLHQNEELIQNQQALLTQQEFIARKNQELARLNKKLTDNENIMRKSYEILNKSREQIQTAHKELNEQNNKINSSIKAALTIQKAILPTKEEILTFWKDYFVLNLPKDVVSGDFHYVAHLSDSSTIMASVDCTGHGIPGAFMSLIGHSLMDKIIYEQKITDPAAILEQLHQEVKKSLRQDEQNLSGSHYSGMDLTLIKVYPQNNADKTYQVVFVGAKRPIYHWQKTTQQLHIIKGDRRSIGGAQNEEIAFTNQSFIVHSQDILYLLTDGFEDQNDLQRRRIGNQKLEQYLQQIASKTMQEQQIHLHQYLIDYMDGTTQRDDILMIGVQLQ